MTAVAVPRPSPAIRLGRRSYPVILPSLRDPRLKVSATVITVHVLGQVALDFPLSIAQILVAVGACAVIEMIVLFRRRRAFVWPASALLTGVGVALILRVVGTQHGDWWSLEGWYIFAGVAAASLLSKYVIRPHGTQIFNPNNVVLTLAFLILGSSLVEPLDFWWGPMSPALAAALAVILIGGFAATAQVRVVVMSLAFWITFAALLAVLAASGHCITARWSVDPVCDGSFWWIVVTSPELLIFLFFMITDPKAIPQGSAGRLAFAVGVAVLAVLFIAPQRTEFGAKVGLLGSMAVFSAVHTYFDRSFPRPRAEADGRASAVRMAWARSVTPARGLLAVGALGAVVVAILLAGSVARSPAAGPLVNVASGAAPDVTVDAGAPPPVTISAEVALVRGGISDAQAQQIGRDVVAGLAVQAQALRTRDPALAATAAANAQLFNINTRIAEADQHGEIVVPFYQFDSMQVVLIFAGSNKPPVLGVQAQGSVRHVTYGGSRGEIELGETATPFEAVFAVAETGDGRYIVTSEVPISSGPRPVEGHP